MNCQDVWPFLGAYLDGELDLVGSLDLEAHFERCPECARELRSLQDLSAAISGAPRYGAPGELRRRLGHHSRNSLRVAPWVFMAAALAVGGVLIGHYLPSRGADRFTKEVVEDHVRSLLADHLLDVPARQQIQPWFAGKLDYTPVLEGGPWRGFELAGARLDYLGGRAVAALVYRLGPHIVNIFVRPTPGDAERAPVSRVADGFHVVSWRAYGMDWWAVSDLSEAELEELAMCPCFMPPNRTLRLGERPTPKVD
ncbi:MAG TPA: anti-sigma factor [Bryobacteraceae bacterium]|nr:anti-sigma factor [Bryobacteraceae bacterium]